MSDQALFGERDGRRYLGNISHWLWWKLIKAGELEAVDVSGLTKVTKESADALIERGRLKRAARLGHNTAKSEAERQGREVRLGADCKAGELSKAFEKAPGKRTDKQSASTAPVSARTKKSQLKKADISEDQAGQWEKLAAVPPKRF